MITSGLAVIGAHTLGILAGAGPAALLLAAPPLLVLVAGVLVAEPDGPPIRWTRLIEATRPDTGRTHRSTSARPAPSGRPRPHHLAGVAAWA